MDRKLSNKTIIGYGFGALSDAAANNFFLMYSLYFMTAIAGMNAGTAGTLISTVTIIAAVVGVVIGPLSDRTRRKRGTRRAYLLIGGIMLLIGLSFLYKTVPLSGGMLFAYYLVFFVMTYFGYATFLVPYNALGAELTNDYNERTKLRTPATFMNCVGNILGISVPMAGVAMITGMVGSEGKAWNIYAIAMGVICFIAIVISYATTKDKEMPVEEDTSIAGDSIVKVFLQIVRLKPFKWIIAMILVFGIGYTVFSSALVYYVTYSCGLSEVQYSTAMLIWIFVGMVYTFIISFFATKTNKKFAMAVGMIISAVAMVIFYIAGIHSFGMLVLMLAFFGFANGCFWLLIYPLMYDMAEVYEYKYGARQEGAIMSLYGFLFQIATAIGTQVLTRSMVAVGFDPASAEIADSALHGIGTITMCVPVACFIIVALCCAAYPLTNNSFAHLMQQLEIKRAGGTTDETGLERII